MNRDFVAECGRRYPCARFDRDGMTGCEFRRAPRQNSRCRIATTPDRNGRLRLRRSRASESPATIFNRFASSAYQPFPNRGRCRGGDAASQHFSGRGCTAGGAGIGQEAADICRRPAATGPTPSCPTSRQAWWRIPARWPRSTVTRRRRRWRLRLWNTHARLRRTEGTSADRRRRALLAAALQGGTAPFRHRQQVRRHRGRVQGRRARLQHAFRHHQCRCRCGHAHV
jgi:hypothetical protein